MTTESGGRPSESRHLDVDGLLRGASELGVALTPEMIAAFGRYADEIVAWNRRMNLTRLTTPEEIAVGHFADALACLKAEPPRVPSGSAIACVDIGSGAGVPGLAIRIVRPDWQVALVEATAKKVAFLEHAARAVGAEDVRVIHGRAESMGHASDHREAYDVAVARAVAELRVLVEYALPLVRVGGRLIALKGRDATAEAVAAKGAIAGLGGRLGPVIPYTLPGRAGARHVVVVEKVGPTPEAYPRRVGVAARRPL